MQCNEDCLGQDSQTEMPLMLDKWTQRPICVDVGKNMVTPPTAQVGDLVTPPTAQVGDLVATPTAQVGDLDHISRCAQSTQMFYLIGGHILIYNVL